MGCSNRWKCQPPVLLLLLLFLFFFFLVLPPFVSPPLAAAANVTAPISSLNSTRTGGLVLNVSHGHGNLPPLTAPLGSSWSLAHGHASNTTDGWLLVPSLAYRNPGPSFACGLLCLGSSEAIGPCPSALFGVFLVVVNDSSLSVRTDVGRPIVVWSANRNSPVQGNATLRLTAQGDLRLEDGQGSAVWSTNTTSNDVAGMNLTLSGNLLLYNRSNLVVWQSYDHPTDTALKDQSLTGKQLVANSSAADTSEGPYSLSVHSTFYSAYVRANQSSPPQIYYQTSSRIAGGKLLPSSSTDSPVDQAKEFVRLEADGHLTRYKWSNEEVAWRAHESLINGDMGGECSYPTVCGRYGFCADMDQCSCPEAVDNNTTFFEAVDHERPRKGCREKVPLSCQPEYRHLHRLLDFGDIAFYGYAGSADITHTDIDSCQSACLWNCSCRGAFFKYGENTSDGDCYLPSTILSIATNNRTESAYNSYAFLKLQIPPDGGSSRPWRWIVELALAVLCALVLVGICALLLLRRNSSRRRKRQQLERDATEREEEEEMVGGFDFKHLPGMPARFTYEELRTATDGFSRKLGEGGFGAVFHGTLREAGTGVAVKLLGHKGQGLKEFLAEVETIGSIHHVNLVRLAGYCAERLHRLLVYEFLSNGSLDRWIYHDPPLLDWPTKRRILLDVARGLSYLHGDCRNRIIHLDIKPQNILLDDAFHAKISDFGLSKLVEREQSQVVTTLRGTPGYIAPEWLTSTITEKVDVYSFGVVVLETVTGKRVLDASRSEVSLLSLLRRAAAEDRLPELVGGEGEEGVALLRVAMWCLQGDPTHRPSMAEVVKVLQGDTEVEADLDLVNFWVPSAVHSTSSGSTALLPSLVSGPR